MGVAAGVTLAGSRTARMLALVNSVTASDRAWRMAGDHRSSGVLIVRVVLNNAANRAEVLV